MHKLLTFFLLATCFLFLSAGKSVKAAQGQHCQVIKPVTKSASATVSDWKNTAAYSFQLSFVTDNEDDEESLVKKNTAAVNSSIFINGNFLGCTLSSNANTGNFNKHFPYPSLQRYILHRVFII